MVDILLKEVLKFGFSTPLILARQATLEIGEIFLLELFTYLDHTDFITVFIVYNDVFLLSMPVYIYIVLVNSF